MEMAHVAHTIKHPGGVYYFNLKTPADLVGHYPKQLTRFSLKTKDPRKAAVLAARHFIYYQEAFDAVRASLDKRTLVTLSEDDIKRISEGFSSHLLKADESLRMNRPGN